MAKNGLRRRPRENRSEAGLLKRGLARWGLTLFISGWMFALGVLVGRGTVPVRFDIPQIQNKLAELKKADQERRISRMERKAASGDSGLPEPSDLYFHERLKENRMHPDIDFTPSVPSPDDIEPSIEEEIAEEAAQRDYGEDGFSDASALSPDHADPVEDSGKPMENKTPLMKKPPHIARNIQRPAQSETDRVSAKKAAVSSKPEDVSPAAPQAAPSTHMGIDKRGRYALQVASFKLTEEAENMLQHLQEKGYRAEHIRAVIHGKGIWHRVQVGAFTSKAEAEKELKRLKKEGFAPIIVSRDK